MVTCADSLNTGFSLSALRLDHQHCGHNFGSSLWAGKLLRSPKSWVSWLVRKALLCFRRERHLAAYGLAENMALAVRRALGPAKARPPGSWHSERETESSLCPPVLREQSAI